MTLRGRVAVVTGGGRGIGRAIAAKLAGDGASVLIADVDEQAGHEAAAELRAGNLPVTAVRCDVTQSADVEHAMETACRETGRLDILVNNAGIARDRFVVNLAASEWDEVLGVNLKGTFLCLQAAARRMIEARYGRIINVSSIAAGGNRGTANYSASKGGIDSLTRTACLELARHNITVNAVAPGAIATRLALDLPPKIRERMLSRIPSQRFGEPGEVASLVAFLASDAAAYINGQVIAICGGLSVGYL